MTNPDTIPLIVGEIERIEASALAGASAASIGDLSYEQQCQLQSALSRLASQLRSVSDRLAALGDVNEFMQGQRRDARRYRWLRDPPNDMYPLPAWIAGAGNKYIDSDWITGEQADSIIDAAMQPKDQNDD